MTKLLSLIILTVALVGCAATQISDRCLNYTLSGDSVDWTPAKFYQARDNQLYIEIPENVAYIPQLEVIDMEFDQPYKIDYTFDKVSHRFKVADNHDEYLLYRETPDGMQRNVVYIQCNRTR